jgi:hypothetical protein
MLPHKPACLSSNNSALESFRVVGAASWLPNGPPETKSSAGFRLIIN